MSATDFVYKISYGQKISAYTRTPCRLQCLTLLCTLYCPNTPNTRAKRSVASHQL